MNTNNLIILSLVILLGWIIPSLLFIGYGFKLNRNLFWKIIGTGLVTPWVIGSIVKIYLEYIGKETLPWSYFLKPESLVIFIPAMIWWGLPFILLAIVSRYLLKKNILGIKSERGKYLLLMGTLTGTFVGAGRIFISVFWLFDAMYILVPVWAYYSPFIMVGVLIGVFLGRRADSKMIKKSL